MVVAVPYSCLAQRRGNPRLAIALKAREWSLNALEEDLYRGVRAFTWPIN